MTRIERGLGKGLSALIRSQNQNESKANDITYITVENLSPNPDQPRKIFSQEKLDELVESIKQKGILQPLLVRKIADDKYQIIAGERRWRASNQLGLKSVPTIVKELSDQQVLEIALIENIQRDNLTPIEEAQTYQKLIKDFGYTQEEVAKEIGVSRTHIANLVRVLTLPTSVLQMIESGEVTLGHAKLLVSHPDPLNIATTCAQKGWSVRSLEQYLRNSKINSGQSQTSIVKNATPEPQASTDHGQILQENFHQKAYEIAILEESLYRKLRMKVEIKDEQIGGKITIHYSTLEELDLLLKKLYSISRDI